MGVIGTIVQKRGRSPFGFICKHNYNEDGFNKDMFFSFKSIVDDESIKKGDKVSFKVVKNHTGSMVWATEVRELENTEVDDDG